MLGDSDFSCFPAYFSLKSCICACPKGIGPYLTNQKCKIKTLVRKRHGMLGVRSDKVIIAILI
jgi:hypothetical protein